MVIIGEKINGAIPRTAKAIRERDEAYITKLAETQAAAGADYLDVCAGTNPEEEYDVLCWLVDVVQAASELPICIDSPDPEILVRVFERLKRPGLINSVSLEGDKCAKIFPLLREFLDWGVVGLCCGDNGVAKSAEEKTQIALELIEIADGYGILPGRIHIDPLVLSLPSAGDSALMFCEAARSIKQRCPEVNVTAAMSNVSFGMPARRLVNRNFLMMAMQSGLDSVIADPTDREVIGTIYAARALLGQDRLCRNYNKAYRAGKLG